MSKPVFRFAPSPNGHLHLGHAYSALLNQKMARESGGKLLLRIEDIDVIRCTPDFEAQMLQDLEWIGFEWDETPRRQSEHFDEYAAGVQKLEELGLVYPSNLSRSQIKKIIASKREKELAWPTDPDGSPLYPGTERELNKQQQCELIQSSQNYALRFDMQKAKNQFGRSLQWTESQSSKSTQVDADPLKWGDVIIARKDFPVSYHLCCTLDDALQGVTHVVRGKDLYAATAIHVLLYKIFSIEKPVYTHHDLILDNGGEKLSKSKQHKSLKELKASGLTAEQLRESLGFI